MFTCYLYLKKKPSWKKFILKGKPESRFYICSILTVAASGCMSHVSAPSPFSAGIKTSSRETGGSAPHGFESQETNRGESEGFLFFWESAARWCSEGNLYIFIFCINPNPNPNPEKWEQCATHFPVSVYEITKFLTLIRMYNVLVFYILYFYFNSVSCFSSCRLHGWPCDMCCYVLLTHSWVWPSFLDQNNWIRVDDIICLL